MFCVHSLIHIRADQQMRVPCPCSSTEFSRWVRQYRCILKAKEVCLHLLPLSWTAWLTGYW